jgi:hypothetical protein
MSKMTNFNVNEDMKNHKDISQLIRTIQNGDPLIVAEGAEYVMVSGPEFHFTFTKTITGYTVEKTESV